MRTGDISRRRRLADTARQHWYAYHRSVRFAARMWRGLGAPGGNPGVSLSGQFVTTFAANQLPAVKQAAGGCEPVCR
jgi:hypothetical protein